MFTIGIIGILRLLLTKFARFRNLFNNLLQAICWNIVIKTVQAGFLAYCLTVFSSIFDPNDQKDLIISSITLWLLVSFVASNFVYLSIKNEDDLNSYDVSDSVGALYSNLDPYNRWSLF
jgi:hypothetical protein